MRVELMCCESTLLREIPDKRITRDSVALTYAFAIRSREKVDWAKVNRAITDRWSVSALLYIKRKAWKRIDETVDDR